MSSYLNLQLLDFGIVDEEGEGFLPQRFMSLILGLETDRKEEKKKVLSQDGSYIQSQEASVQVQGSRAVNQSQPERTFMYIY